MSTATTHSARINGIAMRYADEGKRGGPVVVLHHPLATNLTFWDEATAALSLSYRVIRFDARGHGQTEAPVAKEHGGRYAFETLAADVVALMDHLNVNRAAFVGLSMGGMVAQYLGLLHADRFNSLAIVSSSSRVAPEFRSLWHDRVVVAREKGMASQVEPAMARWIAAATRTTKPALLPRFATMIETTPIEGYAGWCGAIEHLDMTARLGAIKLPTHVIVGVEDPATPIAASQAIQAAIPGATLAILPGVSHMLACEDPASFHATLLPHLARHVA